MTLTIGRNILSLRSSRYLDAATNERTESIERLSSGLRINHPSDDAAGLSLSSSLSADARVYTQGVRNLNDGISALAICEGALHQLEGITIRQKELAEQAASGTISNKQRQALNQEANALGSEFNRIVQSTKFNGLSLLDPSLGTFQLQSGYSSNGAFNFSLTSDLSRLVGDGTFQAAITVTGGGTSSGDVNGDGCMDLISTYYIDDGEFLLFTGVKVVYGNGDGTFSAPYTVNLIANPNWYYYSSSSKLSVRDFNGDGLDDIAFAYDFETGVDPDQAKVMIFKGNRNNTTTLLSSADFAGAPLMAPGDYNEDGIPDLMLFKGTGPGSKVLIGNGDGTFNWSCSYLTDLPSLSSSSINTTGDFNNDGHLDLYVGGASSYLLFGNGDGSFQKARAVTGMGTTSTQVADLNGDGYSDFVGVGSATIAGVGLGNGDGSFRKLLVSISDGGLSALSMADVNDDGIPDIITKSNNGTYLRLGNGDGTFSVGPSIGTSSAPTLVDVNNDNVLDIISGSAIMLGNGDLADTMPRLNICSRDSARASLPQIDTYLNRVIAQLGSVGAAQSRVATAISNSSSMCRETLQASSRITDVDIAEEAARNLRASILQKVASQVAHSASLMPNLLLDLLRS